MEEPSGDPGAAVQDGVGSRDGDRSPSAAASELALKVEKYRSVWSPQCLSQNS